MKYYPTLDYLFNEVSFAKFERVSEVPLTLSSTILCSTTTITILYYISLCIVHSSLLYIDSLSCNQSLCSGIKAEEPISFKSTEPVADSHLFKTIDRVYNEKLFHCTTFLTAFAFCLWDFSFRQRNRFNCKIPYKET